MVNAGERLKPRRWAVVLVFGAGGGQRKVNEQSCLFSGVVNAGERSKPRRWAVMLIFGAGGDQRKVETPKTSSRACFRGWWMLEKGWNPENEQTCSFLGLVAVREWSKPWKQIFRAGGCQRMFKTLKMSMTTRFQGWWLLVGGLYCAPPVPIGTSWNQLDSDQKFGSREPAKLVRNFSNFSDWIPLSSSDSDRFHRKESDQIPTGTKWNQSGIWLEIDIIY